MKRLVKVHRRFGVRIHFSIDVGVHNLQMTARKDKRRRVADIGDLEMDA
jgi:hypothetical protein